MEKWQRVAIVIWWIVFVSGIFIGGAALYKLSIAEPKIEYSGYKICNSAFHTRCEGICQGTQGLVLHYGYRGNKCKFEVFNKTNEDKMWEEFCNLKV